MLFKKSRPALRPALKMKAKATPIRKQAASKPVRQGKPIRLQGSSPRLQGGKTRLQ